MTISSNSEKETPLELVLPASLRRVGIARHVLDSLAGHFKLGFHQLDDIAVTSNEAVELLYLFGRENAPLSIRLWGDGSADILIQLRILPKLGLTVEEVQEHHSSGVISALADKVQIHIEGDYLVIELHFGRE